MKLSRRGFSLYEAMVTLALAAVVMGIGGDLMSSYCNNMRFSATKDNSSLALTALDRVAAEVAQSYVLESPVPGTSTLYTDLRFQELDPTYSWLPPSLSNPLPGSWDPFPPANLLEIHVFMNAAQALERDVGVAGAPPPAPTNSYILIPGVLTSFTCTLLATGQIQLQASLQETNGVQVYTTQALRMTP